MSSCAHDFFMELCQPDDDEGIIAKVAKPESQKTHPSGFHMLGICLSSKFISHFVSFVLFALCSAAFPG